MSAPPLDYDDLAGAYAEHRAHAPEVLDALVARARLGPGSRVLEVGCGTGNYAVALRRATGADCDGLDPSREMLAIASGRRAGVRFRPGRGERLPYPDGRFDLVFSVDVVHHLADLGAHVREAHRVLRPGGRLCAVTDDADTIRSRAHSVYFPETVDPELARYPTLADLRAALAAAGFAAVEEERTERAYAVRDLAPFRAKAFSSLHLIPDGAFAAGLARLERDLAAGPIPAVERHVLLHAEKPAQ